MPRPAALLRGGARAASRCRQLVTLQPRRLASSDAARPLEGLAALPRFHMEKLGGWEGAVHQLAASDW